MNAVSNGMGQAIGSALASAAEANQVLTDMRLRGNGVDATAIRRMQAALSYLDISKSLGEDAGLDCDEQGAGLAWTTRSTMAEFDIADPSDEEDAVANEIGDALLHTLSQQVLGQEKGHGPRFSEFMDTGRGTFLGRFELFNRHNRPIIVLIHTVACFHRCFHVL